MPLFVAVATGVAHQGTVVMETLPGDPTDFFQVLEKLGEGSYGEVYSALDQRTGKMVAIKAVPLEADLSDIQKEIAILRKCR